MKNALSLSLATLIALAVPAAMAHESSHDEPAAASSAVTAEDTGQRIYARTCSVCHGERGNAASWAKNSLNPPPRDFTSAASRGLSRERMLAAVTKGVPDTAMVSFTTQFSHAELEAVIDYVRSTFMALEPGHDDHAGHDGQVAAAVEEHGTSDHSEHGHSGGEMDMAAPFPAALVGSADAGKTFYDDNCADCHGLHGDGRGPRAYFLSRKPRDFTSAAAAVQLNRPHLFEAIAKGVRQTEMAAWSKVLTAQEIADVAEYVFDAFIEDDHQAPHAGEGTDHSHSVKKKN